METDADQSQSLATFEEKLEATILSHQRRRSILPSTQRKRKKICIIPVGLSDPLDEQNIETIIENLDNYLFNDVMLLVWCERTTFHKCESTNNDDRSMTSLFFRHWIQLYLKKPDQVFSTHLSEILKYGGWGDLTTIYTCARQMESAFPTEVVLLENLKKACVKMIGDQLEHDHRVVLQQLEEDSKMEQKQMAIKSQEWISNCANEAPRISNNYKKSTTSKTFHLFSASSQLIYHFFYLVMAKEIAQYLYPLSTIIDNNEQSLSAWKCSAYESYRCLISTVCRMLKKLSSTLVDEQIRSNKRKDRALFCTSKQRAKLLTAPFSSHITNPEPQPGNFILGYL
jgi:hypothetical protein